MKSAANSQQKINCSHCFKQVDIEKSGGLIPYNTVFKSFLCNFCKKKTHVVKCVCKSFATKRDPFFFGEKMNCTDCKRDFNIVPCPVCKQMNLWNGDYYMGAYINCFQCKSLNFQHLACAFCHEPNFWVTNKSILSYYKCGLPVSCYICKKNFQHLMCPHCKDAIYFKESEYIQGIKQNCPNCKKSFQHVNCPGCGDPTFFKENEFLYGKNYKCGECKTNFCLSICDHCGVSNSIVNKIIEVNTSSFECSACKNKYKLVCCPSCKGPNYPITEKGKCCSTLCLYCKHLFKVLDCKNCNYISSCSCVKGGKHKCGFCKKEIENKEQKNILETATGNDKGEEVDKDKFICKICYDKAVDTIFLKCGHVCACFGCVSSLKKKECPMCRVESEFKKCFF